MIINNDRVKQDECRYCRGLCCPDGTEDHRESGLLCGHHCTCGDPDFDIDYDEEKWEDWLFSDVD